MASLGFVPINAENTAFSNSEIIVSDLQKKNIVRDESGEIRVIDADMKLHLKDAGGKFKYPPVEEDMGGEEIAIAPPTPSTNETSEVSSPTTERSVAHDNPQSSTVKVWEALTAGQKQARMDAEQLTKSEIYEWAGDTPTDEQRAALVNALAYLDGKRTIFNKLSYLKIYEDVRIRPQDAAGYCEPPPARPWIWSDRSPRERPSRRSRSATSSMTWCPMRI